MWDALLWLYIINATLLIVHEIDSAYWKEWDLFGIPGGIGLFLFLHVLLIPPILWGLVKVVLRSPSGLIFSIILGLVGIIAFCLHTYFLRQGRPEFRTPASISVLGATLVASLLQLALSFWQLAA